MIILGLTGSIAMGKSTIANMFAEAGIPTTSADAIVHELFASDKKLIGEIKNHFPNAVINGTVDRKKLGHEVFGDEAALKKLETLVHPRVRASEIAFVLREQNKGVWMVVLDIPLLFETGADARVDKTVVVTAAQEVQRKRAMARDGMTEEKFLQILQRQLPDSEKRNRADYIIETDISLDHSRAQVLDIIEKFKPLDRN
ncbi:MAG: dephospho-CoA kinase [Alphaproteobacteria bacterium]|nr:dephospho-CoA kinase [Alphaproteobacteria bacterium]